MFEGKQGCFRQRRTQAATRAGSGGKQPISRPGEVTRDDRRHGIER